MILAGKKTATRRIWKKPMVKVGNIYKAKLKMLSKDYFAEIKITKLFKQKLYDMKKEDAIKEGYSNLKEFEKKWIEINGDWNGNQEVYVVEFELAEEDLK